MRPRDGWRGMVPQIPVGGRAARLFLLFFAAVAGTALLGSLFGWGTLVLLTLALIAGVGLGGSGALDKLLGEAANPSGVRVGPSGGRESERFARGGGGGGGAGADGTGRAPRGGTRPEATSSEDLPLPTSTGADLPAALAALAEQLGVARLVVWARAAGGGTLEARLSSGRLPPPVAVAGQPLQWSLEQDQPLRLDAVPAWADGPVATLPFDSLHGRLLMTVESELAGPAPGRGAPATTGALPDEVALRRAAVILRSLLDLAGREEAASAAHARFERILDFLRDVPREGDGRFADGLADAAVEVAGGVGAAVASWRGESGQVLATTGPGGGPAPGTWFGVMEGDFAMAARAGAILHRDRRDGRLLPLADTGERWSDRPRFTGIVPLRDADGATSGLVAVWGDRPLARDGLDILEALGPLLALELHHASDLARFRQRATEDALTGLGNRGGLEERLELERRRFHRYRRPVAVLVLDLDHFKAVNDTHGHPAGDAVLARVGEILRNATRDADYAARYGGEELVVLMGETMRTEAAEVAERIRATIARTRFDWNGTVIPVTASIGVSACPECVDDPAALMRSADEALYASKEGGRNRVTTAVIRSYADR